MNFNLSEEQQLFQNSVAGFLQDHYDFHTRQTRLAKGRSMDTGFWQQCAELGWLALPFSEEDGGLDGGAIETMLLFEQLGQYLVLEPFLENLVLFGGVLKRCLHPQRKEYLARLIDGNLQGALAHYEVQSRGEVENIATTATRTGTGFCISGDKTTVYNLEAADVIVISAQAQHAGSEQLQLFLVPKNHPGLAWRAYPTADGRRAAELHLDKLELSEDALLAEGDKALDILREVYDDALVAISAEHQGAMTALISATTQYSKERKQFGAAIASFQVLQHRMVDMYIASELARSLLYCAAIKCRDQSADAKAMIAAAKVRSDLSAKKVVESAIQIHGGIATTDELSVGHYLKRITVSSHLFGSTQYHLRRYGKLARQLAA